MIDKMQFISLTGPKDDFDRVIDTYVAKYNIQLENTMSELKSVKNLRPFIETNIYKDLFVDGKELLETLGMEYSKGDATMELNEACSYIREVKEGLKNLGGSKKELLKEKEGYEESLKIVQNFKNLQYAVDKLEGFKFIKYRFGRLPIEFYKKFEKYVYDDLDTVFYLCSTDKEYAWGVYFAPSTQGEKIDAIFASLHFECLEFPKELTGTPEEACAVLEGKISEIDNKLLADKKEIMAKIDADKLLSATRRVERTQANFDLRKLAATSGDAGSEFAGFYIICGWIPYDEAKLLKQDSEKDDKVYCVFEEYQSGDLSVPPTRLKNPKLFKPFEMYIRMYGMPNYNEFDPTIFVALTYSFIFGAMFGDLGQGLFLFLGGLLLYKLKKVNLAAIVSMAGLFSAFFGAMFGSLFGFEDIIPAIWLRPISNMSDVTFIGKLNTVFVIAIAFGMGVILVTMILNVINGLKAKEYERALFDTNGIAGLVFYGSVVLAVVLFMNGKKLPGAIVLIVMFILPLIAMVFKEPLGRLISKEEAHEKTSVGMFFVQAFFEMFEVLLSYFSNTLSFVRVGAFAVSHAAMMEVVLMLAGAENGGMGNIVVIILGNLFVCGMEGLIVGIQVLRLEYYEMFSRFYKGNGREFVPTIKKEN